MKAVELQRCARIAIETCGRVRSKERVLIVTDTVRDQSVAQALMAAALATDAEPVLMVMPTRRSTPQEPPAAVRAAMQAADIAFLYTTYSLTHSSARVEAQKAGARIITMPGVTEDGFLRTLSVDMDRLVRLTNGVADRVSRARMARVTTVLGTDMRYELEHPLAILDGVVEKPGDLDAFPPGLFLSVPRAKSASGVAVVDGNHTGWTTDSPSDDVLRQGTPCGHRGRQRSDAFVQSAGVLGGWERLRVRRLGDWDQPRSSPRRRGSEF